MPIPEFIAELRAKIGTAPLWLSGVTAVIHREVDGRSQVLLVKRMDNGRWTPVTGIVDPGEEPHITAVREAAEEACVVAEVERLVWTSVTDPVVYDNGDVTQYLDLAFRCRWISGEPAVGDDENSEVGFFDVDALPELSPWNAERVAYALSDNVQVRLGRA